MADFVEIDPDYRDLLAVHGLDSLEGALATEQGQRLDKAGLESWRQRWRLELRHPDRGTQTLYLKRFVAPPIARQWQRWWEGSPAHSTAHVEWHSSRLLAGCGIPAARAVALGERMIAGRELASYVILQEVAGESLERIAARLPESRPPAGRQSVEALARFVARFHAAGFAHRDLYLSHVFLLRGRSGEEWSDYVLIDLQRVFRPRWRARRWRVKDLAALACSTPVNWVGPRARLRFLCRYLRCLAAPNPRAGAARRRELRRLSALINRRAERMKERAARRQTRPVSMAPRADGPAASVS